MQKVHFVPASLHAVEVGPVSLSHRYLIPNFVIAIIKMGGVDAAGVVTVHALP